ncbi:MAG: DUF3971 domain-containing protein, partial [Pseudomonadota bacterium]
MVFMPILILVGIALGIAYFRLSQGPVALAFLAPQIEDGINATLNGYRVEVGGVVVAFEARSGFEVQLQNLTLKRNDGVLMGTAPSAAVALNHADLLSGRMTASRVDLIEPSLAVSYVSGGGLSLTIDKTSNPVGDARNQPLNDQPPITAAERDARGAQSDNPQGRSLQTATTIGEDSIDLASLLSELSQNVSRDGQSQGLEQIGFRDATVRVSVNGDRSVWLVPEIAIDLDKAGGKSRLSGEARVSTAAGPVGLTFRSTPAGADNTDVAVSVRGLKPKAAATVFPRLDVLRHSDIPINADGQFRFKSGAMVASASVAVELGQGQIAFLNSNTPAIALEKSTFQFDYDGTDQTLRLEPSTVRWGGSRLTVFGAAQPNSVPVSTDGIPRPWAFDLRARQGELAAQDLGLAPIAINTWQAVGALDMHRGKLNLQSFQMNVGGSSMTGSADFETSGLQNSSRVSISTGRMGLATALALWPSALAKEARDWVAKQTIAGEIENGTLAFTSGRFVDTSKPESYAYGSAAPYRIDMQISGRDVTFVPRDEIQPVSIPSLSFALINDTVELTAPDGQVTFEGGHALKLSNGRYLAARFWQPDAKSETTFEFETDAKGFIGILESPVMSQRGKRPDFKSPTGIVSGDIRIVAPMAKEEADRTKTSGKITLTDGAAKDVLGELDVQSAKITFNFDNRAVNANGDFLIAGVPAKLNWQKIFKAEPERQPPLRISAKLDETDRKQLNIDASSTVRGTVPIELTLKRFDKDKPDVHLRADLTNAELNLDNLIWRKAPGRAAFLDADLIETPTGLEVRNLTVAGDDIAVEGIARFDKKQRLVAFDFSSFSLNLVTRFAVKGSRSKSNIWKVDAKGPRYDGRAFFRSLFSVGKKNRSGGPSTDLAQAGIDLSADLKTVIGFSDTSLHGLKMTMSKRGGRLTELQAHAILDGGQPLAVELYNDASTGQRRERQRQLRADSTDAGQAFRLVGFYPNVNGGRVRLQVDLEGRGAAQQTGTLWVENFDILGDALVAE